MQTLHMLSLIPTGPELWIVLVVVLVLFGGKKIPELLHGVGKGVGELQKGLDEGRRNLEKSINEERTSTGKTTPEDSGIKKDAP